VNLLGGRAWRFNFFPLTSREIQDFDLLTALSRGLLPNIYLSPHFSRAQRAYITVYLKEEVQTEGLVRNLPAFSKFLDVVGFTHGNMVNYANISNEVGVSPNTVKEYYQILVDTLLGYQVYPYRKQVKRQVISSMPKFYLFDVGIAGHLAKKTLADLAGPDAGAAFAHFILMELMAYRGIREKDFEVTYWRTKTGLEVDFILGRAEVAIEVKLSTMVRQPMLKGLEAFMEEHHPKHAIVVSQDLARRHLETEHGTIQVIPWKEFLDELWSGLFL
jgi:predicted AAA+ superfamily ATPase